MQVSLSLLQNPLLFLRISTTIVLFLTSHRLVRSRLSRLWLESSQTLRPFLRVWTPERVLLYYCFGRPGHKEKGRLNLMTALKMVKWSHVFFSYAKVDQAIQETKNMLLRSLKVLFLQRLTFRWEDGLDYYGRWVVYKLWVHCRRNQCNYILMIGHWLNVQTISSSFLNHVLRSHTDN